ncbi:MAG: ABC transporter ATP-binding protein [Lachnospiraceae bacterium]|nr:ABC transporter ATP-binding protein [Lachnospiraceae bacterium]
MTDRTEGTALQADGITFRYIEQNKRNVLDNVSIGFPAGRITVLMGSSGSGKSTLAAVLAGLYPENAGILVSGTVSVFGQPLEALPPSRRALQVSMMFQNADLQFCMKTLRDEMLFCLENISCPPEAMDARISEAARTMGMTDCLDRPFAVLSGGEKQKAALTCLFLLKSKIILLDEPFANIDSAWTGVIIGMLKEMNRRYGTTVIAIDHVLDDWMEAVDEIQILCRDGEVVSGIRPSDLAAHRELFHREGLRLPGEIADKVRGEITEGRITVAAEALTMRRPGRRGKTGPVLLDGADAGFAENSITALLGPSGCGKTTFFRTLLGQERYEGSLRVTDDEVRRLKSRSLLSRVGIVFQNPSHQFVSQNVLTEVETGILGRLPHKGECEGTETEEKALALLRRFHLDKYRRYSPFMLSQGQQRRLAVLSVLAGPQSILLLDEPTYGQDDAMTQEIMRLLQDVMTERPMTVIMTSHDRRLVREWADRVYVFREGGLSLEDHGKI